MSQTSVLFGQPLTAICTETSNGLLSSPISLRDLPTVDQSFSVRASDPTDPPQEDMLVYEGDVLSPWVIIEEVGQVYLNLFYGPVPKKPH